MVQRKDYGESAREREVIKINRKVEQLAARVAHNHEVAGSSPALATNKVDAAVASGS
jgi:hypothetical protein